MWELPYWLFRGGTSKGPLFIRSMLPKDPKERDALLLKIMGSPHASQVDGLGGVYPLNNKVCIVGASVKKHNVSQTTDVDYLLCQLYANSARVETDIDCGNMLAAVGPYAIETGLVKPTHPITKVRIFSENTHSIIEAYVPTPNGKLCYEGQFKIDGVEGSGSPIKLRFLNPAGSTTGKTLPTGQPIDVIEGIEVTCIDIGMPMIIVAAQSLGVTGYESKVSLDSNQRLMVQLEHIRRSAAFLMGLGDVAGNAMPKICLVTAPKEGGNVCARYIIAPFGYDTHPSFAITGAMCLAGACYIENTVANRYSQLTPLLANQTQEKHIVIEHPVGQIPVFVELFKHHDRIDITSVSLLRTARPIAKGSLCMPGNPHKEFALLQRLPGLRRSFIQAVKGESTKPNVSKLRSFL